jgi:acetyl-CoA decarbonylase/synthase complex subunit gamma
MLKGGKAMRSEEEKPTCCCSQPAAACCGEIGEAGKIPQVQARLDSADRWGGVKARLGIKRMKYIVEPGLYALANPGPDAPVLVTANYKLSFDALRKELPGLDAWILVLDTKGINVWCAAGKGTFGTDELVRRIEMSGLEDLVTHRRLIVPQLGATGVAAHEVKKRSGFSVTYGPVRAADLLVFLEAGMKAAPEMRRVRFDIVDRLKVIPVEVTLGSGKLLMIIAAFILLSGLNRGGYSFQWNAALVSTAGLLMAYIAGTILGPLLLPWLPGRRFSVKGAEIGFIIFIIAYFGFLAGSHIVQVLAWLLLIPSLSSFLTMNFTGSSTYTSLSGVKKEMKTAVPVQAAAAIIGALLWLTGRFI